MPPNTTPPSDISFLAGTRPRMKKQKRNRSVNDSIIASTQTTNTELAACIVGIGAIGFGFLFCCFVLFCLPPSFVVVYLPEIKCHWVCWGA
jgi:hypothetical protein